MEEGIYLIIELQQRICVWVSITVMCMTGLKNIKTLSGIDGTRNKKEKEWGGRKPVISILRQKNKEIG